MRFWLRWLAVWMALGVALRSLFLYLYPADLPLPAVAAFIAGGVNDFQAFFLAAGLVAGAGLISKRAFHVMLYVALAVTLLVLIAEIFFWLEFESRLDRLVFHYLAYPKEVIVFLEDQFYLSIFVVPFLLITWGLTWLLKRKSEAALARPLVLGLVVAGVLVGLVGAPLGQSNSRMANAFASNGYLGVLTAARYPVHEVPWLKNHVVEFAHQPVQLSDPVLDRSTRRLAQQMRHEVAGKRHVVLIIEESFAGPVWQQPQLREKYLPNFSALAERSVSFDRLYATGSRTTRGLEALLSGFPPLPGISTTERDRFERLPSLARAMSDGGLYPVFLYGGWPGFSNFSNYWRGSGFKQVWTRDDFDESFETSWGVADGALFTRLLSRMSELTAAHERVFLATLTVSHHRPYEFPEGVVSFSGTARRSEYAMAYADQVLGDFFAAASRQSWYDDTLFVVVADHGLHPRGDALIPAASYRIPLLLLADGLQPRVMAGLGSSMSLAKTLMSLLQISTAEQFAGADMLCHCDTVVPLEFGYHIGLLERERLLVVRSDGGLASWVFEPSGHGLTPQPDGMSTSDARRVLDVFAPAYAWFYEVPRAPLPSLAEVYNTQVAGQ